MSFLVEKSQPVFCFTTSLSSFLEQEAELQESFLYLYG